MENIEEAVVHPNGSVTIRYYFGKTVVIPAYVIADLVEEQIRDGKTTGKGGD